MIKRADRSGFTLIELMLVVIIIGILVSMVAPRLAGRTKQAKEAAAKADIEAHISLALDLYEMDNGVYPSDLKLLRESSDTDTWKGPYLKKEPKDPWGNTYKYETPGKNNKQDYDLYSYGPNGGDDGGGGDDIANW